MGDPLAIKIESIPCAPDGIVIYWYWGAETRECVKYAVLETRDTLRGLENCTDLETVVRALLSKQEEGAGLCRSIDWYERCDAYLESDRSEKVTIELFESERAIYDSLLAKGIPAATDRNSGLIGVTPLLNEALLDRADWIEWIDVEED